MAVIHHAGYRAGAGAALGIGDAFGGILDYVRSAIADDMWRWFEENKDNTIVTIKKWFFSFSVKVRHLEPLFVVLFGKR